MCRMAASKSRFPLRCIHAAAMIGDRLIPAAQTSRTVPRLIWSATVFMTSSNRGLLCVGNGNLHIRDTFRFGEHFRAERHNGGDAGLIVGIQAFRILQTADVKAFPNLCYQICSQFSGCRPRRVLAETRNVDNHWDGDETCGHVLPLREQPPRPHGVGIVLRSSQFGTNTLFLRTDVCPQLPIKRNLKPWRTPGKHLGADRVKARA